MKIKKFDDFLFEMKEAYVFEQGGSPKYPAKDDTEWNKFLSLMKMTYGFDFNNILKEIEAGANQGYIKGTEDYKNYWWEFDTKGPLQDTVGSDPLVTINYLFKNGGLMPLTPAKYIKSEKKWIREDKLGEKLSDIKQKSLEGWLNPQNNDKLTAFWANLYAASKGKDPQKYIEFLKACLKETSIGPGLDNPDFREYVKKKDSIKASNLVPESDIAKIKAWPGFKELV